MKASDLIKELEKLIEEHGDVDVTQDDEKYGGTLDVDRAYYRQGEIIIG